jgi:preprotein translocase subunit SecG
MVLFISIIHVLVALFMILVVLVQGGNQGGVGAAFGGGNTQGVFGAGGATSFLGKLTYGAAAIFMISTLALVYLEGRTGNIGLSGKLRAQKQQESVQQPAPAAEEPAKDAAPGEPAREEHKSEESK